MNVAVIGRRIWSSSELPNPMGVRARDESDGICGIIGRNTRMNTLVTLLLVLT